jgi:integrase
MLRLEVDMSSNKNHPKKGSRITVDPIRDLKDIKKVKRKLKNNPRDLLLFTLGINNGLRISDLLNLRVGDVRGLAVGETLKILETKTGKMNVLMVNKESRKVLDVFLAEADPGDEEFLFKSRKGVNRPITKSYVNQKIKEWTRGMKGNFGTHSMRKTFGFIQRKEFGVGFEILCKRFGHSNPSVTMRYLGIEDKEVSGILLNEI